MGNWKLSHSLSLLNGPFWSNVTVFPPGWGMVMVPVPLGGKCRPSHIAGTQQSKYISFMLLQLLSASPPCLRMLLFDIQLNPQAFGWYCIWGLTGGDLTFNIKKVMKKGAEISALRYHRCEAEWKVIDITLIYHMNQHWHVFNQNVSSTFLLRPVTPHYVIT